MVSYTSGSRTIASEPNVGVENGVQHSLVVELLHRVSVVEWTFKVHSCPGLLSFQLTIDKTRNSLSIPEQCILRKGELLLSSLKQIAALTIQASVDNMSKKSMMSKKERFIVHAAIEA